MRKQPEKPAKGKKSAAVAVFLYLARTAVMIAVFLSLAVASGKLGWLRNTLNRISGSAPVSFKVQQDGLGTQLSLIGQLDLFHALFYGILPALLIVAFLPPATSRKIPAALLGAISVVAALLCAWLPIRAGLAARPSARADGKMIAASVYVGINVAAFIWFHFGNRWPTVWRQGMKRLVLIADALLPAALWSACRYEHRKAFWPLRAVPILLLALAPVVPWLHPPLSKNLHKTLDPAFRNIDGGLYYQVLVDPADGNLVLTNVDGDKLIRLNPADPAERRERPLPSLPMQAFALDEAARELVYVSPADASTYVLDADTLEIRKVLPLDRKEGIGTHLCRTQWDRDRGILVALCGIGTVLVCPDGRTVRAAYMSGAPGDVVLDRRRGEINVALIRDSTLGRHMLMALDGKTLQFNRWLSTPRVPERLAIDPAGDRLLATFPVYGRLLVLDLKTYEPVRWVETFLGVRAIAIDEKRRRLILTGFSSITEVRSLDDYSLIDRYVGPTHTRWAAVDPEKQVAYVTSAGGENNGLWALDLDKAGKPALKAFFKRIDPFFWLINKAGVLIQRLLGWESMGSKMWPANSMIFTDACPPGAWYSGGALQQSK